MVDQAGARRRIRVRMVNSSDFNNGGSTIMLTLDSAIADEAQVRVSYAGINGDGCIGCGECAGGV